MVANKYSQPYIISYWYIYFKHTVQQGMNNSLHKDI